MKIKKLGVLLSAVCFSVIFATTSWAANVSAKIGYFEFQTVLAQSKWGKQSNEEFKKQNESIKTDVEQKSKTFRTAKDEFDKKKDVWDQKTREKKQKELADMQAEVEKLFMEANQKLNKLSSELSEPIVSKVMEIVKKIAKDQGYDYVFEREKAGLFTVNEKDDLTKKVVEELDKVSPLK